MTLPARIDQARAVLEEAAVNQGPAVLGSSMGLEDMVLIDMIAAAALPVGAFTLDTGRLHPETHDLIQMARARYRIPIQVYMPEAGAVESLVRDHGPNGMYESVDVRRACCDVRKLQPLKRALAGRKAWITGLRRAQSVTRAAVSEHEWDQANGLHKFNPLAAWSLDEVRDYIRRHDVPYNPLHDKGYASIGCAPCTRPIGDTDDERAGRWWWEHPGNRECGLHPAGGRG